MNYKLKHLSRFCCNPANELEFEAVKMACEIEGIEYMRAFDSHKYVYYSTDFRRVQVAYEHSDCGFLEVIPVYDFIKKIRMTEEEAQELEDDRVDMTNRYIHRNKSLICNSGYYWKTNKDGTEVTLHKR